MLFKTSVSMFTLSDAFFYQGESEIKTFSIDKYVLPKFEVTVDAPSYMLVADSIIKVPIKAK